MITYRPAVPTDTDQLVSLLDDIMRHHCVVPPVAAGLQAVAAAVFASPGHSFLVAEEDGAIVGMCALLLSYSTWSAAPVCELQDVVVKEDRRRRQVGRGLMKAAEKLARERGCSRLFLLAESWNLPAQRFYRSLGLAEKTCLYYERDLTEPSA